MSIFIILMNLIYLAFSRQERSCDYYSTINEDYKSLNYCKNLSTNDDTELQCCVGVQSVMGQNKYFCDEYNKTNTEKDISYKIDELINSIKDTSLGVEVKAKASCKEDLTPFKATQCSIEDTQNFSYFWNCSEFIKKNKDNYCCLFNGTVGTNIKSDVQFCYEVNEEQAKNIEKVPNEIEKGSRMENIQYINCSPDIPEKKVSSGFVLNKNNLLVYIALIISLIF